MAFDDWGELQTVPHVLGIAHPTGYPTYILTAWLFELLPIGSVAFRANLLAAVCVAVALAAMTSTALRLGVRPAIAVAAAVATGAIGTVWASAVVAEVNALHLAFIALIVDRSLAWADGRRTRDLALGGLLIGLSLGNHLLTAFVAPFFVLFALWEGRSTLLERKRRILAPVLAGLAGLAVYLYIPIAASLSPPLAYNHPTTFEAFRFLVTGEQFRGQYDGPVHRREPRRPRGRPARAVVHRAVRGDRGAAGPRARRPRDPRGPPAGVRAGLRGRAAARDLRLGELPAPRRTTCWSRGCCWASAPRWRWKGPRARPRHACRVGPVVPPGPATAVVAAVLAVALVALNLPTADRSGDTLCPDLRGRHVRGASGRRRDPLVLGTVMAPVARPAGAGGAARRAHRGRHEHRLRRLGHARGADRLAHLLPAGVHPAAQGGRHDGDPRALQRDQGG